MSDLNRNQSFADGDLVTALKLKNLIDLTTINPTFVSSKDDILAGAVDKDTDTILVHDFSTGLLKKIKVSELLNVPVLVSAFTADQANAVQLVTSKINGQTNSNVVVTPFDGSVISGVNWVSPDGITVTVTSTAHGLTTGNSLVITASNSSYSGDVLITVTSVDQFTYALPSITPARTASAGTLSYTRKGSLEVAGRLKVSGKTSVTDISVSGSINLAGDLSVANKPVTQSFVPAGAVMPFANNSVPSGWLKAGGQLVSRTTYADLFAAIGTTYGAGDGSTTFALPDLRGEFIRGYDDGRSVDTGRVFGSAQTDLLEKHKHNAVNSDCQSYGYVQGYTVNAQRFNTYCDTNGINYGGNAPLTGDGTHGPEVMVVGTTTYNTTSVGVVGDETRPRNIALLYCIKY